MKGCNSQKLQLDESLHPDRGGGPRGGGGGRRVFDGALQGEEAVLEAWERSLQRVYVLW